MAPKKRFLLRLDEQLYQQLEKWSADELRSVNAQIEYVLAQAVKQAGRGQIQVPGQDQAQPD
jgi:hypothetical protein